MGELSTGIKVAVTLVVISFVIAIGFFIFSISQSMSSSMYNEIQQNIKNSEAEIEEYVNVPMPLVAFPSLLEKHIQSGTVTQVKIVSFDGATDATYDVTSDAKSYIDKSNDAEAKVGHIVNYSTDTHTVTIQIGG